MTEPKKSQIKGFCDKPSAPQNLIDEVLQGRPMRACHDTTLELNGRTRTVACCGVEYVLKPMEYRLLKLFISFPDQSLHRERIKKAVWGADIKVEVPTINALIKRLRNALFHEGWPDPIRSVRGDGYKYEAIYRIKNGPKVHKPPQKIKLKPPLPKN